MSSRAEITHSSPSKPSFVIGPAFSLPDSTKLRISSSQLESGVGPLPAQRIKSEVVSVGGESPPDSGSVFAAESYQEPQICIGSVFSLADKEFTEQMNQEGTGTSSCLVKNICQNYKTIHTEGGWKDQDIIINQAAQNIHKTSSVTHVEASVTPANNPSVVAPKYPIITKTLKKPVHSGPFVSNPITDGTGVLLESSTAHPVIYIPPKSCSRNASVSTILNSYTSVPTSKVTALANPSTDKSTKSLNSLNQRDNILNKSDIGKTHMGMSQINCLNEKPPQFHDSINLAPDLKQVNTNKEPEIVDLESEDIDDCILTKIDLSKHNFFIGSKIHNTKVVIDDSDDEDVTILPATSEIATDCIKSKKDLSIDEKIPQSNVSSTSIVSEDDMCVPLDMEVEEISDEVECVPPTDSEETMSSDSPITAGNINSTAGDKITANTLLHQIVDNKKVDLLVPHQHKSELPVEPERSNLPLHMTGVTQKLAPCNNYLSKPLENQSSPITFKLLTLSPMPAQLKLVPANNNLCNQTPDNVQSIPSFTSDFSNTVVVPTSQADSQNTIKLVLQDQRYIFASINKTSHEPCQNLTINNTENRGTPESQALLLLKDLITKKIAASEVHNPNSAIPSKKVRQCEKPKRVFTVFREILPKETKAIGKALAVDTSSEAVVKISVQKIAHTSTDKAVTSLSFGTDTDKSIEKKNDKTLGIETDTEALVKTNVQKIAQTSPEKAVTSLSFGIDTDKSTEKSVAVDKRRINTNIRDSTLETRKESKTKLATCKICYVSFPSRMELVTHTWNFHRPSENKRTPNYKCETCKKAFVNQSLLKLHRKIKCAGKQSLQQKMVCSVNSSIQNPSKKASYNKKSKYTADRFPVQTVTLLSKSNEYLSNPVSTVKAVPSLAVGDKQSGQSSTDENVYNKKVTFVKIEKDAINVSESASPNQESIKNVTEMVENNTTRSCMLRSEDFRDNVEQNAQVQASSAGVERSLIVSEEEDIKPSIDHNVNQEHDSQKSGLEDCDSHPPVESMYESDICQKTTSSQPQQHQNVSKISKLPECKDFKCFVCEQAFSEPKLRYQHMCSSPGCKEGITKFCSKCSCIFIKSSDKHAHISLSKSCWLYEMQLMKESLKMSEHTKCGDNTKEVLGSQTINIPEFINTLEPLNMQVHDPTEISPVTQNETSVTTDLLLSENVQCGICKNKFPTKSSLEDHYQSNSPCKRHNDILSHKDETVVTKMLPTSFPSKGQSYIKCSVCGGQFETKALLILHFSDSTECRQKVLQPSKVAKRKSVPRKITHKLVCRKSPSKTSLTKMHDKSKVKNDSPTQAVSRSIKSSILRVTKICPKNLRIILSPVTVMCGKCYLPFADELKLAQHIQMSQTCLKKFSRRTDCHNNSKKSLIGDGTVKRGVKRRSCEIATGISDATSTVSITAKNVCTAMTELSSEVYTDVSEKENYKEKTYVHTLSSSHEMTTNIVSAQNCVKDEMNKEVSELIDDLSSSNSGSDTETNSSKDVEYKCKFCSEVFTSKSIFSKHIKLNHQPSQSKKLQCKVCTRKFHDFTGLQAHLLQFRFCFTPLTKKLWKRKHTCCMCQKILNSPNQLRKHCFKDMTCRLRFVNAMLESFAGNNSSDKTALPVKEVPVQVPGACNQKERSHLSIERSDASVACDKVTVSPAKSAVPTEYHQGINRTPARRVKEKCEYGQILSSAANAVKITTAQDTVPPEQFFSCLICDSKFSSLRLLMEHSHQHIEEIPLKCERCDITFLHYNRYVSHQAFHIRMDKETRILSEKNSDVVKSPPSFWVSKLNAGHTVKDQHHKISNHLSVCLFCHQSFSTEKIKVDHISNTDSCLGIMRFIVGNKFFLKDPESNQSDKIITSDSNSCEFCGNIFSDKILHYLYSSCLSKLEVAILRYRASPGSPEFSESLRPKYGNTCPTVSFTKENFKCTNCNEMFENHSFLMDHQNECGKFTDRNVMPIVDGPEDVYCFKCKKYFKTILEVKNHQSKCNYQYFLPRSAVQQADWDMQNLKCKICDSKYTARGYLIKHMIKEHYNKANDLLQATRQKRFLCTHCRRHVFESNLQQHFDQHKEEFLRVVNTKPLLPLLTTTKVICIFCKNKFSRRKVLMKHLKRKHTLSNMFTPYVSHKRKLSEKESALDISSNVMEKSIKLDTVMNNAARTAVRCKLCNKHFSKLPFFKIHLLKKHHQHDPQRFQKLFSPIEGSDLEKNTGVNECFNSAHSDVIKLENERHFSGISEAGAIGNLGIKKLFSTPKTMQKIGSCKICYKNFKSFISFKFHIKNAHKALDNADVKKYFLISEKSAVSTGPDDIYCFSCSVYLTTLAEVENHRSFCKNSHLLTRAAVEQADWNMQHLRCKICDNSYVRRGRLINHMIKEHCNDKNVLLEASRQKTLLCFLCNKNILELAVQNHFEEHREEFLKAIKEKSELPMTVISQEICVFCNDVFFSRENVSIHVQNHSFLDIFSPNRSEATSNLLETHSNSAVKISNFVNEDDDITSASDNSESVLRVCLICHSGFDDIPTYQVHLRTHIKKCRVILKNFAYSHLKPIGI